MVRTSLADRVWVWFEANPLNVLYEKHAPFLNFWPGEPQKLLYSITNIPSVSLLIE